MRGSWSQPAAGALVCAVVGGLLLLPGRLLGPSPQGAPLSLAAAQAPYAVEAVPVPGVVKHRHVTTRQAAAVNAAPAAQLASVLVPRTIPVSAAAVVQQTAAPTKPRTSRPTRHIQLPAEPGATATPPPTPVPPSAPAPTPPPATTPAAAPPAAPATTPAVDTTPTRVLADSADSGTDPSSPSEHADNGNNKDQGDRGGHGDNGNHGDGHGSGHNK
jgi:hypothetical protein